MTAASNIADLDAALARTGETVIVKHWTATSGAPRPSVSASIKASVRPVKADELTAGIDQTWSKVVLSPTGLSALLPLAKGDKITIQGRERHIELPKPILVADTLVRIDVLVSG